MNRVLHVTQPTSAGVASVVDGLVVDQLAAGWEVSVACPSEGPLPGTVADAGAQVHAWAAVREVGTGLVDETRRLGRLISTVRPHLVHLHSAKAGLAGRLAVRGRVPTMYQPHAWSFEAASGLLHPASVVWERFAARWTDLVVCVSEHERRRGEGLGVHAPMAVVPNGVDLTEFPGGDAADRNRTRRQLGLPDGPLAVCVGRLCRQKGQDVLLAAWPRVVAAVPDARLVIVGDGPDRAHLVGTAPAGVTFVGATTDPRPWYIASDVVVLPSRWEGMALVLLEAMACRRCVVATDVGGVREVLRVRGAGVVPVDDHVALADALVTRLSDPALATAEGTANRLRVVSAHDRHRVLGRMRELYLTAVGRPVPRQPARRHHSTPTSENMP